MVFGFGKPNIEKLERKKDIKGLIKALNYKSEYGQSIESNKAQNALIRIGEPSLKPVLNALKSEKVFLQQKFLINILGSIGNKKAVEPLINLLKNMDNNEIKGYIATALGEIGDPDAIGPLKDILLHISPAYWENYVDALDKLGWKPKNDKLGAIFYIEKKEWVKLELMGETAVEPLIQSLSTVSYTTDDSFKKMDVIKTLGKIGDKRAVEVLFDLVNDEWSKNSAIIALYYTYKAGKLNSQQKNLILRLREQNLKKHSDHHWDEPCYGSQLYGKHEDEFYYLD